jgi:hypothetical protein
VGAGDPAQAAAAVLGEDLVALGIARLGAGDAARIGQRWGFGAKSASNSQI